MQDLQDLKAVGIADVWKAGRRAAQLRRTREATVLRYDDDYAGPALSFSLPVQRGDQLFPGGAVPPALAGLLPEGRRLTALRRAVKTSPDDELTLLLAVGADAVGNVQVMPEGQPPGEVRPALTVTSFEQVRFADLFAAEGVEVDRTGLPGVQDKVSAAMLSLPVARRSERYLLKLSPPEHPLLVEDEAFCLGAAQAAGISTPTSAVVFDIDGRAGLLVTRFDRTPAGPLAFEDTLQVLGRWPSDKYLLTSEQVCTALSEVCAAPVVAARELLRRHVFAYLSGNGDAHARNWGVLQDSDGEWRISPAFDLPSSLPYGDTTMATSLGGRRREDLTRAVFLAFGACLGLPERAVRKAVDQQCAAVELWLPGLDDLPFRRQVLDRWRRSVRYRQRMLSPW